MAVDLGEVAIYISALSLVVAAVALGWNIYRDVVLKAQLKVALDVVEVVTPGLGSDGTFVSLTGTNFGPGDLIVEKVWGTSVPWAKRVAGDRSGFIVMNPVHGDLPARISAGESVTLLYPHQEESFLSKRLKRIGLVDSYHRKHSASRRDVKSAMKRYRDDFASSDDQEAHA